MKIATWFGAVVVGLAAVVGEAWGAAPEGAVVLERTGALRATSLRCEYMVNPLALPGALPRLSWVVESARRGDHQVAYRVLVSSTREALDLDTGDLWDSGMCRSAATAHIEYPGLPLASGQRCWWKVRAWDRDGNEGPWSEPAHFAMGLLKPEDWRRSGSRRGRTART
jgi:alpha-L-rhamnosidase